MSATQQRAAAVSRNSNVLTADGDFTDTGLGELDETGTFTRVNEWTLRDGATDYTLAWDANGQLTDDDQSFEYVYDAFGRMVEVRNQSHTAVVKYRYNGLGYRILWQWDVDADTVLENDERTYLTYDERWRVVAAFRNSDSTPKERWVHHAAGGRGYGSSSYIDSVALRDRDANAGTGAADGTLEERRYLGQNHRADVSFVAGSDGNALEWVRYSSYGVAYSVPKGDYDADGDVDTSDTTELIAMIGGADGWWKDFNIDGSEDSGDYADHITYRTGYAGGTGGRGVLSRSGVANRVGYAGYQRDPIAGLDHVRNRVLRNDLGRWTKRDPLGYVDGMSLYEYVKSNPIAGMDPSGLAWANIDFVWHYFVENHDPVDLASIGLIDSYMRHPAIKRRTAEYIKRVGDQAKAAAVEMMDNLECKYETDTCGDVKILDIHPQTVSISRDEFVLFYPMNPSQIGTFLFGDWTFSIGGHRLVREATCVLGASCCSFETNRRSWSYKCGITFTMLDRFQDPLDVMRPIARLLGLPSERVLAEYIAGGSRSNGGSGILDYITGSPYDITGSFGDDIAGHGIGRVQSQGNCCPI